MDLVQGAVHEPLIDTETFEQVQVLQRSPRRTPRGYALRGIVRCGVCGRRMQGSWNNGKPYYRCTFLSQYAAKNKVSHPTSVYLREELFWVFKDWFYVTRPERKPRIRKRYPSP